MKERITKILLAVVLAVQIFLIFTIVALVFGTVESEDEKLSNKLADYRNFPSEIYALDLSFYSTWSPEGFYIRFERNFSEIVFYTIVHAYYNIKSVKRIKLN